jgi:Na+-transporting NADH:ubiquinone oxidoreductase subunit B
MSETRFQIPQKWFLAQQPMLRVCYALTPLVAASVYFFGWRALALSAIVLLCGIATEALFVFNEGKPVTSAVLVTCLIFSLSLPPTLPFWMAVVGIVVAVAFGKMAFGGFGRNIFNPAMVGRCFIYVTFPTAMTSTWAEPIQGRLGGLSSWAPATDAITSATTLIKFKEGVISPLENLFFGNISGSLGETSALLILLGGAYLIYKKAAPWRIAFSCLLGGIIVSGILNLAGINVVATPLSTIFSGSFLFGMMFVATEPISGAKTKAGQWIYGFMIGGLTIVVRGYSNFSEGIMFSVLIMNAFVPIMDQGIRQIQEWRKTPQ